MNKTFDEYGKGSGILTPFHEERVGPLVVPDEIFIRAAEAGSKLRAAFLSAERSAGEVEAVSPWVKTSDKLPASFDSVLGMYGDGENGVLCFVMRCGKWHNCVCADHASHISGSYIDAPKYWMPIPELPE